MDTFSDFSIIPVLVIEDSSWAADLGHCLVESGLPVVEVTLRTPQSWSAIEAMKEVSGLTLGMGSVTKKQELDRGRELGLEFAVSAGFSAKLVEHAKNVGMEYLPGVATPSEMLKAVEHDLSLVKWFPAETLGGVPSLRASSAPFPALRFVPTGGISALNINSYLNEKNVKAVGGSWMFSKEAMANKDVQAISAKVKEALTLIKEIS